MRFKWQFLTLLLALCAAGCGGDGDKGKGGGNGNGSASENGERTDGSGQARTTWGNAPIALFGRDPASGTYGYFKKNALGDGDYKSSVKQQPGSAAVVQGVAGDKYAIGYSGIGYETADVRAVPLAEAEGDEFVAPTAENVDDYPLSRYLFLTVAYEPNTPLDPLRREFVKYVFSRQGQEQVVKDGYLPVSAEVAGKALQLVGLDLAERAGDAPAESGEGVSVDPALPDYEPVQGVSGTIKSEGSDTMNNLMALWSEGFREIYPNVTIEVQGKGSGTAIPALIAGTATFGPMSRPPKPEELQKFEDEYGYEPTQLPTSIDMLAVFVNKDNPIEGLTLPQVDAIFSETRKLGHETNVTTWGQLGLQGE